jgi:hypothetical protein
MVVLARACWKPSREVMLASCLGCVFHVLIALGKKEFCMVIVLVCGLRNLTLCHVVMAPVQKYINKGRLFSFHDADSRK